jgi:hypothetical protein
MCVVLLARPGLDAHHDTMAERREGSVVGERALLGEGRREDVVRGRLLPEPATLDVVQPVEDAADDDPVGARGHGRRR